ncbi:MAG: SRPBCC family protein [Actinobacteria bacterium]|nr:SRPBCC family protein [Actinomycetota bacterium]
MTVLTVTRVLEAPAEQVWDDLSDLGSHVEWMADAEEITFIGQQREGVGTRFRCLTRVGPLQLTDEMVVTAWLPPRRFSVDHRGLVGGHGTFFLDAEGDSTRFTWHEELLFPWYFGGPLGALVARPVLKRLWQGNLARLAERF